MRFLMPPLPEKIETEEENDYWLKITEPILTASIVHEADQDHKTSGLTPEENAYLDRLLNLIEDFEIDFYKVEEWVKARIPEFPFPE